MSISKEREFKEKVQRLSKSDVEFLRLLREFNKRLNNQES